MTAAGETGPRSGRGCIFFNFGTLCTLQLLVSIHTLRKHYDGPITVFLAPDEHSDALKRDIETLGAETAFEEGLSKSFDRHRIFEQSPYETTLVFDSDLVFRGPIDELWEPLEREGVLVTGFHALPHGVDGTPDAPGFADRTGMLSLARELVEPAVYERAVNRLKNDRVDINVGVMGLSGQKGDRFLADWTKLMERGRGKDIPLLDEMLVNLMIGDYSHHLADEIWNCPADEYFRKTNVDDARVLHFFADGYRAFSDYRMGRNPLTWAGRKWYAAYFETAADLDVSRWRRFDRKFDKRVERPFDHGVAFTLRNWSKDVERGWRTARDFLLDRSYWKRFR